MNSDSGELSSILNLANDLFELARYEDAIPLLSRVIQAEPVDVSQIFERLKLAECHLQSGSFSKSLVEIAQIHATIDNSKYLDLKCFLFDRQIYLLLLIYETMGMNDRSNFNRLLNLVDEGLQHLNDIGKENLRFGLLFYRSLIFMSLGDTEHALIDAEESYRLAKDYQCDYLSDNNFYIEAIIQIGNCAFMRGNYNYGIRMLNELNDISMESLIKTRYLTIRVKLLLNMEPPRITEALNYSKELIILADKIQATDDRIFAYSVAAQSAIASISYKDALQLIKQIECLSINNNSFARPYYLRIAIKEILSLLKSLNINECSELKNYIISVNNSIDRELINEKMKARKNECDIYDDIYHL